MSAPEIKTDDSKILKNNDSVGETQLKDGKSSVIVKQGEAINVQSSGAVSKGDKSGEGEPDISKEVELK